MRLRSKIKPLPVGGFCILTIRRAYVHYENYYTGQLYVGISFQQFINYKIFNNKLHFLKDQTIGENEEGVEVKMDNLRKQTGNFYVETAERAPGRLYSPSGIFRSDNSRFWLIGDYSSVYILKKDTLIAECLSKRWPIIENSYETGLAFLLPETRMEEIAPIKIFLDRIDNEIIAKLNDVFFKS